MTEQEQITSTCNLLRHVLHNEWVSAFRKLMMMEQFSNPMLASMYEQRYITLQYEQHAVLFRMLMDAGKMRQEDPYTLAVDYVSPVIVMINMCDRDPSREDWAIELITNHVRAFNKKYRM